MIGWGYKTSAPVALLSNWWESGDSYKVDGVGVTAQQKYNTVAITFEAGATEEQRKAITDLIRPLANKQRLSINIQ